MEKNRHQRVYYITRMLAPVEDKETRKSAVIQDAGNEDTIKEKRFVESRRGAGEKGREHCAEGEDGDSVQN